MALLLFCFHLSSGLRPVVEETPQNFVAFDLGDLLQHLDDLSDAEIDTRLEHQFTLLDQDKDGLLTQQERTEIWSYFLQPIAQMFFPETDMLTLEDFCEKDHRLVPSELTGDEHFFTIEQVCEWEDHVADESCESDWEVLFADANEISRNEFVQRFVEVLNNDNSWTFANYKELMMSKERKHFRQVVVSSDESNLVPVNKFTKKSERHCTELHASRRELGFILSALGTVLAILLSSTIAGLSAGINAGCEGNCFDGGAFNVRNFVIEGTIAFGSSALITSTCVVTSGMGCIGAGVGAGVLASIAQGTVCELQPDDWNYVPGQTGCTQDCCWQPKQMIQNVVFNTISAGLQTSAVRNFVVNGLDKVGLPATSELSTNLFGVKGGILPEWGFTGLAHAQYGIQDVGMAAVMAALNTGGWSTHAINELWKTGEQMQKLSEYKSVVLQPNQFSDQVSLLNEVRRDTIAQNLGLPCAQYCSHSGQCSFCGNAYCCEKGVVSHGCDGTVGGDSMRVCVAMTIGESDATIDAFKEKAMVELKFSHVQLTNMPWCVERNPYISKPEVRRHYELKMPDETCRGNTDFFSGGLIVNPLGAGNAMNHRIIFSEAECREAAQVFSNEPMQVNPTWGTHPYACSIKFQGNKRIPIWNDRTEKYGLEDSSRICYRHDPLPVTKINHHTWESDCSYSNPESCPGSYYEVGKFDCMWWRKYRSCQKWTWECPSGYSVARCSWNKKDTGFDCRMHAMCRKNDMSWENEPTERVNGQIVYPSVVQAQPEKCADKGYELDINTEFDTFEDAMAHCMSSPSCGAVYNHWPLNCRFFADVAQIDDTFNMPPGCEYATEAGSGLKKDMFYAIKLTDPQNFCPIQSDPDARVSNFKTLRADGNFVMLQGKEYNGNVADCADHYNYFTYYPFVTDQEEVWASSNTGWANLLGFVHGFAVDMDQVEDVGIVRQAGLSQVLPLIIPSQRMECSEHRWTQNFECPQNYAIQGFFTYGNEEFSWVRCCQGVIEDSCHWESQSDIQRMECSNAGYVWAGLTSSGNKFEHIDSWKCCEVPPTFGTAAMTAVGHMCEDGEIIRSFRTTIVPGPTVDLVAPYLEQCHAACDSDLSCTHFSFRPAMATITDLGEVKNGLGFCTMYHSRCETLITKVDDSDTLLFQMNKRMEILELLSSVKPSGCSLKDEATWVNIQEPLGHGIENIANEDVYVCAKACAANGYSILTFGQGNNDEDVAKCLCRDNIPSLSLCANLDVTVRAEIGQPEFHLSSNPNTLTVFKISIMNKITAVQTNNGTLFVDIGRARFNDLFDKCPVVALNTAEGQSIYRRTADWTNELDAYSLFTFEFRATGNVDADYVTYKCNGGSCEIAEVRQWLDLGDIRSRTNNPEIHMYLFPASKCPTSFDVNILPCDAVPESFTITDAVSAYGDKLVHLKQAEADMTLGITSPGRSPHQSAAAYSAGLLFSKTYEDGLCGTSVVENLGTIIGRGAHTTYIRLDFPTEDPIARQWILNIGQENVHSEHWIWTGHSSQLGSWGHNQIQTDISSCSHLVMTFDGVDTLNLYCDGIFIKERTGVVMDIKNSDLLVGGNRIVEAETGKFQGCIHEVTVWNEALSSEQIKALVSSNTEYNDFSSEKTMIANGWVYSDYEQPRSFIAAGSADRVRYCPDVPDTSYCGYSHPGVGVLSVEMMSAGTIDISYGNSWGVAGTQYVTVEKNGAEVSRQDGPGTSSFTLSVEENDVISFSDHGECVINVHSFVFTEASECKTMWVQKDGYFVREGHGETGECYSTLERAQTECDKSGDCNAIAAQSNVCGGQYRVTHGGPTLVFYDDWVPYGKRAWERVCATTETRAYLPDVLHQCQERGTLSKHDNGCLAYHRGWKEGDYECAHCGGTSRNYAACDLEECRRLCADLYSENLSQIAICNEGCETYHELGGCLAKREPSDVLLQCEDWGTLSKNHNGCRAYHRGWEKGDYDCAHCGETSRDYAACDLAECELLCEDLYSGDLREVSHCNEGCQKYHELGGCSGIITTQLNRINDMAREVAIAGEVKAEHAGCAWECNTDAFRVEVSEPSVSACTKLASQRGSDFFAIDSTGACLFPDDYPDVFAFDECPMSHTCNKDYYTVATNWENFECSAFHQVLDKNSQTFQSCNNDPSFTTEATITEDCETACNLLSGCSYFIFTQALSECLLFTTCELSYEPHKQDGMTSVLMRRGMGDALNDQVPRLISSDEQRDTMIVRSPDARDEAYVSCPVGFLVTDCLCALDSCKGASISGRYCTAFGEFVAAQATCLREKFVNSHSVITQDSASFDCGSDTVLGCTCSSKRLDDCDVVFQDGQCRLRPLSTGDTAYERSCVSGSCSDGWQHLQVFDGYMIEVQRSHQRITIPKGSYNVETLRKMLPDDFEWDSFNIVAFTQSDDRHVQAICADVRPNFNREN